MSMPVEVESAKRSDARHLVLRLLKTLAFILFASQAAAQTVSPQVVKEIAPEGKLRAAINFGNPVLAQKDATTGEPRGISADLSRELARRLGVPVEFVPFEAAGKSRTRPGPARGTSRFWPSIPAAQTTSHSPRLMS